MKPRTIVDHGEIIIPDPSIAHQLFSTTMFAWLFAILRVYVGWQWVEAGLHKVADPKWVQTGEALQGFWLNAVKISDTGRVTVAFDWYRSFLQFMLDTNAYTWFAKLVAYGELVLGIALIVGAFVGVAAFLTGFMNWNFIMAGSASTNGMLFALSVLLILAWKVAGYYGVDYYLLRYVGVPWKPQTQPLLSSTARATGD